MIEYCDFDEEGIVRVGCMKCNLTVASRRKRVVRNANGPTTANALVHMTHSKRLRVTLSDSSVADLIVCSECLSTVQTEDLPEFEQTMKWGWMREWNWKFKESQKPENQASFRQFKARNQIDQNETNIPLRVWKAMFAGKEIVRK